MKFLKYALQRNMRNRLETTAKNICQYPKDSLGWLQAVKDFNDKLLVIEGEIDSWFLQNILPEIINLIEDGDKNRQINYPKYDLNQILIKEKK